MIENFKHKGLRQLYEEGNAKGVNAQHREKLEDILAALDAATKIEDLRLPTCAFMPSTVILKVGRR